jgi:chitin synthase
MKNMAYLCKRDHSKTWGKDGWKKVVICIVSDGPQKINSCTLSIIATIGVYQEGIATNIVNGKAVTAHIYEYTTQSAYPYHYFSKTCFVSHLTPSVVSVTPSNKIEGAEKGIVPVQVIFCLKEKKPEEDQLAPLVL